MDINEDGCGPWGIGYIVPRPYRHLHGITPSIGDITLLQPYSPGEPMKLPSLAGVVLQGRDTSSGPQGKGG